MRSGVTAVCAILLCSATESLAGEPAPSADKAKSSGSLAVALLREASEITLKQRPDQEYWTERVLLDIGDVQIRARDFEGAQHSIRGSAYHYGRNAGIVKLAESLARDGKLERAQDVLRSLDEDHGWGQAYLDDGVQLQWIEHLVATGRLDRAGEAVRQLRTDSSRGNGFLKIASAYAKSGDGTRAAAIFEAAIASADKLTDEFDRARALWQTAGAQLATGAGEAAKATLRKLIEQPEYKDSWAKVAALREAGALAFQMNDLELSRRLFRRAIESRETLTLTNKIEDLNLIAVAQARAGDFEGALQTAALITHDNSDHTRDGRREQALSAAAVAMQKAGDVEGALRTAFLITSCVPYRDDALREIVDFDIRKRELAAALAAAGKIAESSAKAAEILKIAAAYAKSGDRATAGKVASRIELTGHALSVGGTNHTFDYRSPQTWGVCYEPGFTMSSIRYSHEQAAKVAAAAITLARETGQRPEQPYETAFKDFDEVVVRSLARTHSSIRDGTDALVWARRIGSNVEVASKDDFETLWAVERRIHALVGVAEGLLDRMAGVSVDHDE